MNIINNSESMKINGGTLHPLVVTVVLAAMQNYLDQLSEEDESQFGGGSSGGGGAGSSWKP